MEVIPSIYVHVMTIHYSLVDSLATVALYMCAESQGPMPIQQRSYQALSTRPDIHKPISIISSINSHG